MEVKQGQGKKGLVTGASRGIGQGIALTLAAHGYDLAITHYADHEAAAKTARQIEQQYGTKCIVLEGNLADSPTAGEYVEAAVLELGKIDVLVNNAGVTINSKIIDMSLEQIDFLLDLNFRGHILATQAVAKHMIARQIAGSIINITSTRSERAYPTDAIYGGTKAALTRAAQSIALELAPYRIRVNCIAPGSIMTRDMNDFYKNLGNKIPLGRVGTPDDIGNAVLWLASEQASYITGTTLRIDGGLIVPGMPENVNHDPNQGWGV